MTDSCNPVRRSILFAAGSFLFFSGFLFDFGDSGHLWQLVSDAAHTPIFLASFLGIWWFAAANDRSLIWCALITVTLVLLIEFIQPSFGRSASVIDICNGMIGVLLGIAWVIFSKTRNFPLRAATLLMFLGGATIPIMPALSEIALLRYRQTKLPTLADFEDNRDLKFWSPISENDSRETIMITQLEPFQGISSLKIHTIPLRFSGAELRLESANWSEYNNLIMQVHVESPRSIYFRIDDWEDCSSFDSRFNMQSFLHSGWNTIKIETAAIRNGPKFRALNISKLRRLLVFVEAEQRSVAIKLDNVRLQ